MKTEAEIERMLELIESFRYVKSWKPCRDWQTEAIEKNKPLHVILGTDLAILKNKEGIKSALRWVLE